MGYNWAAWYSLGEMMLGDYQHSSVLRSMAVERFCYSRGDGRHMCTLKIID